MNDRAVANVVGAVLLLAALLSAYGYVAQTELPRRGAEAERFWAEGLDDAFRELLSQAQRAVQDGRAVDVDLPSPFPGRSVNLPILGGIDPAPASGSALVDPDCGNFTASRTLLSGETLHDLNRGVPTCIRVEADMVYSEPLAYHVEFGGLLRVQGERAVVLRGPVFHAREVSSTEHRITLALPSFDGGPDSTSLGGPGASLRLTPGVTVGEAATEPNAASASWVLNTTHPEAWKAWFTARLAASDLPSGRYSVTCLDADADGSCDREAATRRGKVTVTFLGPADTDTDLTVSLVQTTLATELD